MCPTKHFRAVGAPNKGCLVSHYIRSTFDYAFCAGCIETSYALFTVVSCAILIVGYFIAQNSTLLSSLCCGHLVKFCLTGRYMHKCDIGTVGGEEYGANVLWMTACARVQPR